MHQHPGETATLPEPGASAVRSFKDRLRQEWNGVADAWGTDRWWRFIEQAAQGCNDHLVRLAEIGPGHRVLDVGTGIGEPAVTAARQVGPEGYVLGVDLAHRMIEHGRRRLRRLGLPNVNLQEGDAETLDLAPASFDAVLSRWTLMLFEDLSGTLGRLRSLLRPGGHLAAGLWGHPSRVPMISASLGAAARTLNLEPPPMDGPTHLWIHGAETLERIVREAGFSEVHSEPFDMVFDFPSPRFAAEFVGRMAGPLRLLLDHLPDARAEQVVVAVAEALSAYCQSDGTVRMVNETLIVAGRRPLDA